jgi:hypothetical protein
MVNGFWKQIVGFIIMIIFIRPGIAVIMTQYVV